MLFFFFFFFLTFLATWRASWSRLSVGWLSSGGGSFVDDRLFHLYQYISFVAGYWPPHNLINLNSVASVQSV